MCPRQAGAKPFQYKLDWKPSRRFEEMEDVFSLAAESFCPAERERSAYLDFDSASSISAAAEAFR